MPVAADASLVAHGLVYRLPQRDAHIFHGVMAVNVQITFGLDVQVNQAVACNLVQHMVKKTDAGVQTRHARAIQIDTHRDLGLGRAAGHHSGTRRDGVWQ